MKVGILGGTFDPIHLGHIQPALAVYQQLQLESLWLMPNHIPPHKANTHASTQHRLAMVNEVCQHYPQLALCDIEINRDKPSYSVHTLELLTRTYPQHEFYFIMGMDSFMHMSSWYQWPSLFDYCHLAICARPGWQLPPQSPMHDELIARRQPLNHPVTQGTGLIFELDTPLLSVSSTDIRQQLQQHTTQPEQLLPYTWDYICQHKLYRSA